MKKFIFEVHLETRGRTRIGYLKDFIINALRNWEIETSVGVPNLDSKVYVRHYRPKELPMKYDLKDPAYEFNDALDTIAELERLLERTDRERRHLESALSCYNSDLAFKNHLIAWEEYKAKKGQVTAALKSYSSPFGHNSVLADEKIWIMS